MSRAWSQVILFAAAVGAGCRGQPEIGVRHAAPVGPDAIVPGHPDPTSTPPGSTPSGTPDTSSTPSTSGTTGTTGTTGTETTDPGTTTTTTGGDPPIGVDVSHWQGNIDWGRAAGNGIGFMVAKATEGTYFTDGNYFDNLDGAWDAGIIAGGYHFAIPDDSSGTEQAQYFVDHGGGWTADGQTLPGTLDIEYNPNGSTCYGLSQSSMEDWVQDFVDEYTALTGTAPIVYTNANWWDQCVGSSALTWLPLWVAHYGVASPNLPTGWSDYTIWQYTDAGNLAGIAGGSDEDIFNGPPSALRDLADGV